jgi:rhamnogalacturonan endolyase
MAATKHDFTQDTLLFKDTFDKGIDTSNWIIEKAKADSEVVTVKNGKLLIDTYGGATVWYKKELSGNILISYKRKVIVDGGKNDRLSDLNQFWMVTDPVKNKLFKASGGFAEYDSLDMYYVGMGGNYNTTTRFRKYNGGDKKIIKEYNDATHLLQANKEYIIQLIVKDGWVKYIVDGNEYFSWKDEKPYTHGYFGIRSTRSRQEIDDVQIYQLK